MHTRQVKRERPTFKTAHDFHRNGGFTIDPKAHSLFGKEREGELEKIHDALQITSARQFPRTQNLEYAILKAHLIIEYAITQYIRFFSRVAVRDEDIRFTFSQRLEIAYLMGFGANDPILLPTIERMNKTRNQVAHTFHLDRIALDEMLRVNSADYDGFKLENDRERIKYIRHICAYICGRVSGEALAAYALATRSEERENRQEEERRRPSTKVEK